MIKLFYIVNEHLVLRASHICKLGADGDLNVGDLWSTLLGRYAMTLRIKEVKHFIGIKL